MGNISSTEVREFFKLKFFNLALGMFLLLLTQGCLTPPTVAGVTPNPASKLGFSRSELRSADRPILGAHNSGVRERVVWAGIATTVSWSEIPAHFPKLTIAGGGGSPDSVLIGLDQKISTYLKSKTFDGFDLVDAGQQRDSDIALAFLLNKERFSQEKSYDGRYLVEYGLLGELVFIDQQKQEILGSYPIGSNVRDQVDNLPGPDKITQMVGEVVCSKPENSTESISLIGQFKQALDSRQVSPRARYCFEVGEVAVSDNCRQPSYSGTEMKQKQPTVDAAGLEYLRGEIGAMFASDLGNNTGLSFNPYVSRHGGSDNILALHFRRDASRSIQATGIMTLRLPSPVRKFNIAIDSLSCEVDPEWTGKYVVNLIYGFAGSISVVEPVTGRAVGVYPFGVSLKSISRLPKDLRETYWQNSRRKLTPDMFRSSDYDQQRCWKNSLENFLDQKTAEMLFEKADKGNNYQTLRADLGKIGTVIQK